MSATTINAQHERAPQKQHGEHSPINGSACYSDEEPLECGRFVVVKCTRVDKSGVWGTLSDWGTCTAYLPLGSIGREKGRGERRAQAHFVTNARRQSVKGFTFVGIVQDVEEVSSTAIDNLDDDGCQITSAFHATITRRGVTEQEEKETLDRSRRFHRYANLVERAADTAGVSRLWARRMALYNPYHRASALYHDDKNRRDPGDVEAVVQPEMAAILLLDTVGQLPPEGTVEVERLLIIRMALQLRVSIPPSI